MMTDTVALIDAELAAFMQGGVSLNIGACSAANMPSVVRAFGCRVSPDRRRVTMLVSGTQAALVQADICNTGMIAAVFSQPSTHRTVQLKGRDAAIGAVTDADLRVVVDYRDAFVAELAPLGFDGLGIRALLACPDADLVALKFTPCAAFSQTPGPSAGESLKIKP